MGFTVYTATKEPTTSHERRALTMLIREMVTRFSGRPEPYALFIGPSVYGKKLDLLAVTCGAIVIVELKEASKPGGVIHGTENGPWTIDFADGTGFTLNAGRQNPYEQVDGYRTQLINWLGDFRDRIFSFDRRLYLPLDRIDACLTISPSLNTEATMRSLSFLGSTTLLWFRALGREQELCDFLFEKRTRGLDLTSDEITALAKALGQHPRSSLDDITLLSPLELPQPSLFGAVPKARHFLDREQELALLQEALDDPNCSVIGVSGLDGTGKTYLVSTLCERLTGRRETYWLSCTEQPVLTLERLLLTFAAEMPNEARAQMVADPYRDRSARIHFVLDYLDERDALLVFDDYHFLDQTADLFSFLQAVDTTCRHAQVLLITGRLPEFAEDPLHPIAGYKHLDLQGLPEEHVPAYLQRYHPVLARQISPGEVHLLHQKTGGNPRFVDILAGQAADRPIARVLAELRTTGDPRAEAWFKAQLRKVSKPAHTLGETMSVIPGPLGLETFRALNPEVDASAVLSELETALVVKRDPESSECILDRALREFFLARASEPARRRYHRKAAQLLMAQASEASPAAAVYTLQTAIEHASQASEPKLILRKARFVVDTLDQMHQPASALRVAGLALAAAEESGDQEQIATWSIEQSRQLRHAHRSDDAVPIARRGLEIAEKLKRPKLQASAYHEMGMLAQHQHDPDQSRTWHQRALVLSRSLGNQPQVAKSLGKLGDLARAQNNADEAIPLYQESARLSEESGNYEALAITYTQLGTLEKYGGHLDRALEHFTAALQYGERCGQPQSQLIALGQLAEVYGRLGDPGRGLALIDQALQLEQAVHTDKSYLIAAGIKADLLIAAGRSDDAEALLVEIESLVAEMHDPVSRAFNLKRRGLLAALRGDLPAACAKLEQALAVFRDRNLLPYAADCESALAALLPEQPKGTCPE